MKKAIILCNLDGFANSVKPQKIKHFLERNNYTTEIYSTVGLSRLGSGKYTRFLPKIGFYSIQLYCLEALHQFAVIQKNKLIGKIIISLILNKILEIRGKMLSSDLSGEKFDLLICENNFDEAIADSRVAKIQILDLPSPLAEEKLYGDELTTKKYIQLRDFERKMYHKADYLSFHWHTYADFVKKQKYNGNNFIDLGYGTNVKKIRARYSTKPKVVFLGYLGGYWNNLKLLEKLSTLYPGIDVYGGPYIPNLKINYKGYAPSVDILASYQFGLITITNDPLRRNSFSSKHLEYFSYGLPVFTPAWRKDTILDDGSIHYDESNFVSLLNSYTDESKWEEKSASAIKIANNLSWEKALQPLENIINHQKYEN